MDKAIEAAGGVTALASLLGQTPQVIIHWRNRGVSAKQALEVERVTGVSRHELRPDLYPEEPATPKPFRVESLVKAEFARKAAVAGKSEAEFLRDIYRVIAIGPDEVKRMHVAEVDMVVEMLAGKRAG